MATLPISDTHRFIRRLQDAGMDEALAETLVQELQQIDFGQMASKADLNALEARLMKFTVMALLAQIAVFAGVVKWF